ncbi:hypothetical protein [Virgisporangium aurantiacum]|uniref:Uncharacterized protein n=1 Tax=Virgisporangium aurantiacum TaxID=175570 RepID=A0A8J3Z666_9ACTN|nr:hypothetical protein [Virgisporangium aurantiacum]GIJ55718.1 hypothetical protein Vau01_032340 [Virgisporangium aurantiacum]
MTGFEHIHVSHHQFLVLAGSGPGDLSLYSVGDRLVQLTGADTLTVLTGPHSAPVRVRVTLGRPGPLDGWDAASEATLFCDRGRLSVGGPMGHYPEAFRGLPIQAGLVRIRVHARNRRSEDEPEDPAHPEEYEVFAWPVTVAPALTTIEDDLYGFSADPHRNPAIWALEHLLAAANPPATDARLRRMSREPEWRYPRVEIRRAAAHVDIRRFGLTPDGDDLVLPVGDAELRFRPGAAPPGGFTATVRWTTRPGSTVEVPDREPSTVEISADGLVHRGVRAEDAVPLGLVWDYLLARTGTEPGHPWEPVFAAAAAAAARRAAETRRRREASEVRRWGGRMPSPRIRSLAANTHQLWSLDPDLAEAIAATTSDRQRAVARWAARRACAVAGLDTVDWIVAALAAVDNDEPLPFTDDATAFNRLLTDPRTPRTTVRAPDGRPNWSQQALAFPAVLAAARPDPLAAALEAVGTTAWAYGDAHPRFLAEARAFLETSSKG